MPQSLFSCLYLYTPTLNALAARVGAPTLPCASGDVPPPPLLRIGSRDHTLALTLLAYCASTVKLVDLEVAVVHAANIHEEDDFVATTFGLDLLQAMPPKDVVLLLRDAEAALLASAARLRPTLPPPLPAAAKKKRGKSKIAALGISVGIESLPVTCQALPTDSCILPSALPPLPAFEQLCEDPAQCIALVDALVSRLRLKRCHYIGQLYMVSHAMFVRPIS